MKFLLNYPVVYLTLQSLIGAKRARKRCLEQFVRPVAGQRFLDVGCGPGFVLDYLPEVHYVGFDIDAKYIRYAQSHYGHRGTFHCAELTIDNASSLGQFDWVLLNGVVHHIDDEGVAELFRVLASCLAPGGAVLTLDGCYFESMSPISRLLIDHDRGEHVRWQEQYERLASDVFSEVTSTHRQDLFRIPYDALVMICRQPKLLT